jgi:excisionase family DNA binding protein
MTGHSVANQSAARPNQRLRAWALPDDLSITDSLQVAALISQYIDRRSKNGDPASPGLIAIYRSMSAKAMQGHPGSQVGGRPANREPRPIDPLLVTYKEASAMLSISESTIKRRIREGKLRPVRNGGCARLRVADIQRFADEGGI